MDLVTDGLRFPEGPVAMPDGSVIVVEIAAGRITRVAPDGTKTTVAEPGGGPNGLAIGPDGKLYVCNNGGFNYIEKDGMLAPDGQPDDFSGGRIERIDIDSGEIEVLYKDGDHGCILRGPNDIVFDKDGGFWFTDHGKTRERERDVTGVFYAKADGSFMEEVIFPLENPNGIGLSPDKVLQARGFAYADAHRYRLGTHYEALPVNAPKCPVHHYHKDGSMRFFKNDTGNPDAYYEPNSVGGPTQSADYREPPLSLDGPADRYDHRVGNDDYTQAGNLFRLMDAGQKHRLFRNIAEAMAGVPEEIIDRQLGHFEKADPDYRAGVLKALVGSDELGD